jgi:hypothetical protein
MKLMPQRIQKIKQVFDEVFMMGQPLQAAVRLRLNGVTSQELHQFMRTPTGQRTPDNQTVNTFNELRELERDGRNLP